MPGKSHGRKNVVSHSPWGCQESDTTEQLHLGTLQSYSSTFYVNWSSIYTSFNNTLSNKKKTAKLCFLLRQCNCFPFDQNHHNLLLKRVYQVWACILNCFSHIQPFMTLCTVTHQALLSRDSPGKNTGMGCHTLFKGYQVHLSILGCCSLFLYLTYTVPLDPTS